MALHEDELRADLQQTYGIDLDHARNGGHSALHVAALAVQLPRSSRLARLGNDDAEWTLTDVLLAGILNAFNAFVWGMSDKKRRGPRPDKVGPTWMRERKRTLAARVLPISELMEELSRPRTSEEVQMDGR